MPPIVNHNKLAPKNLHAYNHLHGRTEVSGLLEKLAAARYQKGSALKVRAWRTDEPVPFAERTTGEAFVPEAGKPWGTLFQCAWMEFTGPAAEANREHAVALIDFSGEGCVYTKTGQPIQGLTTAASVFDRRLGEPGKRVVYNLHQYLDGDDVRFWVDGACNDLFGNLLDEGVFQQAVLAVEVPEISALYYDVEVLVDLLEQLPEEAARYHKILHALFRAAITVKNLTGESAVEARKFLAPELARGNGDAALRCLAAGHAHIDLAWLWPIRETKRKGVRTFSTVLQNMERFPDFRFCASQPQLYQWIRDAEPDLYAKIKQAVADGRWEPVGAMWVESDVNLPGGESLVRQFLHGKRFFKEEFGIDTHVLFVPDDFGYTAALPQLMKKSGVEYLMTIKMSWDQFAAFPYHTFLWKGLGPHEVLVHMPPEGDYNSAALPRSLAQSERTYSEKALTDEFLMLYGIGDGGGGPGEEHLERLKRLRDLQGVAPTGQGSVAEFFERLERVRETLPAWTGEMFLHRHTGTFTTQQISKRGNRKQEGLLREAEFLSTLRALAGNSYPADSLDRIWKETLLMQFHDIIPGSSIKRVYTELKETYARLGEEVEAIIGVAGDCVSNPLSWDREEWIQIDKAWRRVRVPGTTVVSIADCVCGYPNNIHVSDKHLENEHIRLEFSDDGLLTSLYDKATESPLISEPSNVFTIHPDFTDAWDFPGHYREIASESPKLKEIATHTDGPEAAIQIRWSYGSSEISQRISLLAGERVVRLQTVIDWAEDKKMLRVGFSPDIHYTESISEVQFGHVRRPVHRNTEWERGKFEIYAHKWIALQDSGRKGLAILKDTQYGHHVDEKSIDMNILRGPSWPDRSADQGRHEFTYALMPYDPRDGLVPVIRAGAELNVPLRPVTDGPAGPILRSIPDNIVLESVKIAEDGSGTILRLYEAIGAETHAEIQLGLNPISVSVCNLLEKEERKLGLKDGKGELAFLPFEIHTLKLAT